MIANANSIVQYAIQIKNGIMKHPNVSVKINISTKKIKVGIHPHAVVKMPTIKKQYEEKK